MLKELNKRKSEVTDEGGLSVPIEGKVKGEWPTRIRSMDKR